MTTSQRKARAVAEHSSAGYGMLGVIVALLLLSVGVLSVSSVLTQAVSMQTTSSQRTSALYIAQTAMELQRSLDPLTLVSLPAVAVDEDGQPDMAGPFTREVVVDSAGANLIGVTVVVTAPRSNPIRLETWIYDGEF